MKKWLQKGLVITVALLTFGIITPNHEIWDGLDADKNKYRAHEPGSNDISAVIQLDDIYIEEEIDIADSMKIAAKEQAYIKFGTRIGPKIAGDFDAQILPKMEEAIEMTIGRLDDSTIKSLTITEDPSGNYSEKIFNIKNSTSNQDVIRFHVRTDNRPGEGYYYNFHYHTVEDNFTAHYSLGDIYWSKNTPPKWLS